MFFVRNSHTDRMAVARWRLALTIALTVAVCGCGRPQGNLFPTLASPLVWPPPPDTPRIELVGVLSGSDDLHAAVSGAESFRAAFRGPRPSIGFSSPHGIAITHDDLLAVADGAAGAVHIIDLQQRTHRLVSGFDDQRFATPVGVAWVNERLFVTDAALAEVIELSSDGSFRRRFGKGILSRPVGVAYAASTDRLYVVDGGAHALVVFETDGSRLATIGERGSKPGQFNYPTHIAVAGDNLLVADSANFRVQLLTLDGECVRMFGQKGDGAGDLSLPKGVAADADGNIYIVDAHFENVQMFKPDGQLLMAFGREGSEPGAFSLPAGIAIDRLDRIWVADGGNRRLQVFVRMRATS